MTEIRRALATQLDRAIEVGSVYWDRRRVRDFPLPLGPFLGGVRCVPTFAYKQVLYDSAEAAAGWSECRLCEAVADPANVLRLPPSQEEWRERFDALFDVLANNFPFCDRQIIVSRRDHAPLFAREHYRSVLDFMHHSGFQAAAMQIPGSGATVPDHAHISVADESLPIFGVRLEEVAEQDGVTLFRLPAYPGSAYAFRATTTEALAGCVSRLGDETLRRGNSFNFFATADRAYLVLRKQEYARVIGRNLGNIEVSGIYLGNARGAKTREIDALVRLIEERCAEITSQRFLAALRESVCSVEEGRWVESFFRDPRAEVSPAAFGLDGTSATSEIQVA
jgi:hypothetical protein